MNVTPEQQAVKDKSAEGRREMLGVFTAALVAVMRLCREAVDDIGQMLSSAAGMAPAAGPAPSAAAGTGTGAWVGTTGATTTGASGAAAASAGSGAAAAAGAGVWAGIQPKRRQQHGANATHIFELPAISKKSLCRDACGAGSRAEGNSKTGCQSAM